MSNDIRLSISFRECRKRKKLFMKLGSDGVLGLIDLWAAVAVSRSSGILYGWDCDDIALEGNYSGDPEKFVKVLLELNLLDYDNKTYSIHNWVKNQPWVADSKQRRETARKNVLWRWLKESTKTKEQQFALETWFNTLYIYDDSDTTKSILLAYESYTNCNTPLLSSPISSTSAREGSQNTKWICECGSVSSVDESVCFKCGEYA